MIEQLVEIEHRDGRYYVKDSNIEVKGFSIKGVPVDLEIIELRELRTDGPKGVRVGQYVPQDTNAYVVGEVRHESCGEKFRFSPVMFLKIPNKYTTSK